MENSELCVKVNNASTDTLVGFPYLDGQFFGGEEDDETDDDCSWLIIDLADAKDTTTAQEQFLNTNKNVLEWTIR